jgi:hypothetical protein
MVGLYWFHGLAGVKRHILGLYWVPGHAGIQRHIVGLYWVPGLAEIGGNEIADKFARDSSVQKFVGPEPSLGVSTQNIRRKIKFWVENQHLAMWRCHCNTRDNLEN